MPAFLLDVLCPGVSAAAPCEYSSDIQGDAAFIDSREGKCQMCRVLAGGPHDRDKLGLQLANLFRLDPDVFEDARLALREVSGEIWRSASHCSMARVLSSSRPASQRGQEVMRADALASATLRLTPAQGVIEEIAASMSSDTCVVVALSSLRRFPIEVKVAILAMACSDARLLFTDLCRVKSSCYHVFDQPLFVPHYEWRTSLSEDYDETLVAKLARIYSSLLASHGRVVEELLGASVQHRRALARLGYGAWPARTQLALRLTALARRMRALTGEPVCTSPVRCVLPANRRACESDGAG